MSEERTARPKIRAVAIDVDEHAHRAVAAKFHDDPPLDALRAALEGFRRTRAEAAAEVCPCGQAGNPLHALLNHGGRR